MGGIAATAADLMFPGGFAAAQLVNKSADQLRNGEFNWFPERSPDGPLLIIVSIPDQRVHVYRNGRRIAASTCSTGKPGHSTPTGVFKILQKDKHHRSSTYNNAPMPNMNRLTWSGVALHAGNLPGYPASHGCVRLPLKFSELLFTITKLGMTVVIADNQTQPSSVVHPGMVLGDYARQEFSGVETALLKEQYSAGFAGNPSSTSVVVSRPDRTVMVWDNGQIVSSGSAHIGDPDKSIGNRVYTLTGADRRNERLRWVASDYSARGDRRDSTEALHRVKSDRWVREEVRKRMHHGMTLVTTDQPARDRNRSNGDFVVIDGIY